MAQDALGLIETVGLAAAVEAADAAVKAANIRLLGYELTKGGGMVTVKFEGDVGAVQAAVDAGGSAAQKVGQVFAVHVIPRPHAELSGLIRSRETVGAAPPVQSLPQPEASPAIAGETKEKDLQPAKKPVEICNLCGDPSCPRKKGDPKVTCIHYDKTNKEDE